MGIRDHKEQLRIVADDANGAAQVLLGRDINQGGDIPIIAHAYAIRGQHVPGGSRGLDERIGTRAAMAALWKASGGATFVLSESVAASIALTKTPREAMRLCLPAFLIEVPSGYMPSVVAGSFPGAVLVSRGPGKMVFADCFVDRGGEAGGHRLIMMSEDVDEDTRAEDLDDVENARHAGEVTPRWYHRAIIRLVRGTMMWVETFPSGPAGQSARSKVGGFGVTTSDGRGHVFLGTRVVLDAGLRNGAKMLTRGQSFERAKLALRHIVRGHWKRQACGVNKADRKLVYVEPYWRGPDACAAFGRLYALEQLP